MFLVECRAYLLGAVGKEIDIPHGIISNIHIALNQLFSKGKV